MGLSRERIGMDKGTKVRTVDGLEGVYVRTDKHKRIVVRCPDKERAYHPSKVTVIMEGKVGRGS